MINHIDPKQMDMESIVTAVTHQERQFRAVVLHRVQGAYELIRTASENLSDTSWRKFTEKLIDQKHENQNTRLIIGCPTAAVIFYRINVPAVKEQNELTTLVQLQAESKFPLPAEKMIFAWKKTKQFGRQLSITIAAARKDQIKTFLSNVSSLNPEKLLLNCEGIVKAWQTFFSVNKRNGLLLDLSQDASQFCLVEDHRLCNAAILDTGLKEFSEENIESLDRFNQDLKHVLEIFDVADYAKSPIFILSDGRSTINTVVSSLTSAGFDVQQSLPNKNSLRFRDSVSAEIIYEYRTALGIGALGTEPSPEAINLFEDLYKPAEKTKKRIYSFKAAAALALITFILLIMLSYIVDVNRLKILEKHFKSSQENAGFTLLAEQRELMKAAARQRADLLNLIHQLNYKENNGTLLNGFHFKKGQPVTITGQVKDDEQLYNFQESLLSKNDISDVRIKSTKKDDKKKKIDFTLTFHYKDFTQKKGRN